MKSQKEEYEAAKFGMAGNITQGVEPKKKK